MSVRELDRTRGTVLHIRFDGRSDELALTDLKLRSSASDQELKQAVARHYERPDRYFDNYVVVRNSEAIILRPEAIYG